MLNLSPFFGIWLLKTGLLSPDKKLSFTIQVPVINNTSHGNMKSFSGIIIMSPGTKLSLFILIKFIFLLILTSQEYDNKELT